MEDLGLLWFVLSFAAPGASDGQSSPQGLQAVSIAGVRQALVFDSDRARTNGANCDETTGSTVVAVAARTQPDGLEPPVRIFAAGKAIDVTTGHAAPYVYDFDRDGVRDLLVGEFGDGKFPIAELPECLEAGWKKPGNFVNGRVRIYKNHGTDIAPRFEDFVYLQAGGGDATVPIT